MALGAKSSCDTGKETSALVIEFEEPEVVRCLTGGGDALKIQIPGEAKQDCGDAFGMGFGDPPRGTKLVDAIVSFVRSGTERSSSAAVEISFEVPKIDDLISSHVAATILPEIPQEVHARHRLLTELQRRKLRGLQDFVGVFEVLGNRQRAADLQRILDCDPSSFSDAWPKLQSAKADQRVKEEHATLRKAHLLQMEEASDHPDQIAHVRTLLYEVQGAETELEQNRQWLNQQEPEWLCEEQTFQQNRRRRDLAGRQRVAAFLLERRCQQRQHARLATEASRIEAALRHLESALSYIRHAQDLGEELAATISTNESLLGSLRDMITTVKEQGNAARAAATEAEEARARAERLTALQRERLEHLAEIEAWERRLEAQKAKQTLGIITIA